MRNALYFAEKKGLDHDGPIEWKRVPRGSGSDSICAPKISGGVMREGRQVNLDRYDCSLSPPQAILGKWLRVNAFGELGRPKC